MVSPEPPWENVCAGWRTSHSERRSTQADINAGTGVAVSATPFRCIANGKRGLEAIVIEAVKIWNEPNNLSHWNFHLDPDWVLFAATAESAARALKEECPDTPLIMGGMSPSDPKFVRLLENHGVLEHMDGLGVHGFPLDWNHWKLDDWPKMISDIRSAGKLSIWVTEAGVSSFGAEEVQEFGVKRTAELLLNEVDHVFWYSLLDLPPAWQATTRHKENEYGLVPHHTSPPKDTIEFADFCGDMVRRYAA